jgi:hypothetical protein
MVPINKMKIKDAEFSDVIDLQIHKRVEPNGQVDYMMYLVSTNGVLVYTGIEKREDCKAVIEEKQMYAYTPNCTDLNGQGVLLVDAASSKY